MSSAGYYFNGVLYQTPTTVSSVNDNALVPVGISTQNMPCLVGESTGGKPNVPLVFSDPAVAQSTLQGGELQQAVLRAFNPSDETGGPAQVTAFRVNPAIQAALALLDSTGTTVINLTSQDYGQYTNTIMVSIAAGSVRGLKASVGIGSNIVTQDNIYAAPFSVMYVGEEVTATMSITNESISLDAPTGTVLGTVDLTQFTTCGQVVDYINTLNDFSAVLTSGFDENPALDGLDNATAVSIVTETFATAVLEALIDWFNGAAQTYVLAARPADVGTLPTPIGYTFLTGGSDGVTLTSSWDTTFTAMQACDVQWITPVSDDPTVAAMTDAHVQYMSTTGRMERRAICGTPLETSNAEAITLASQINSNRTSLVCLGHYNYDLTGVLSGLQLYPPYITAAALTGAFAAVSPGTPLTNKAMNFAGIERNLMNPTDTDELINGGVIPIENTSEGYKVTQSITTWLIDDKYDKVEQSVGFACDFVSRTIRTTLDPLRGNINGPLQLGRAVALTSSALAAMAKAPPNGPGVIVGDTNSPAYTGISASIVDTALAVQFQCSPALPDNYIGITIYAVPYSGSASA